ncbi:MAG: insulinase family protein [Bacteroidales bacterium]|nr:insulinase family protein [Bacteroidales bacterium]MDD4670403.1 insulinase family protein [Bacteroidales bacterium]
MSRILKTIVLVSALVCLVSCNQYKYETFENDPLNARIYTLDNGLKVYMSVNKDEPRIQTYIAVKVGGKNDPSETTGLAHYFEHLMFKGTEQFGTQNYELEKPLLDEIERQFEIYRKTTDDAERTAIYKVIDSLSYEASKLAIPNEYDKLMAAIGADGTNAYTSYDQTVYVEDIPSNQIENWAKIQADRFAHNVIRGFHTELETVYEEKNMSLTQDGRKVLEQMLSSLFKNHPYGTQTVLGTQEHLKNPSITNIKNYYNEWYVPNNMAICLSGDFDPDYMIKTIDKYFGKIAPNNNLKKMEFKPEEPITEPIVKEVYGLEAPQMTLAWRFPGANDAKANVLTMMANIMNNGYAGLIDLNVNQLQKTLGCYSGVYQFADYSVFLVQGRPKQGQSLDDVKNIVMEQIAKLKAGDFSEDLLTATINNYKLGLIQQLESNDSRADFFVTSFIDDIDWTKMVSLIDDLSKITKDDIVAYANEMLGDNNYAYIKKLQGKDGSELKIAKPQITPIYTNRDTSSAFLREIQAAVVNPIEPIFVDFDKDMSKLTAKSNIPVLYKKNTTNDLFELTYVYDFGRNEDKTLSTAASYLDYLGTSTMTSAQIQEEFYKLACSYGIQVSNEKSYILLSGLAENMNAAMKLMESLLSDAQPDPAALEVRKANILKSRIDAKTNQRTNFSMLTQYGIWGANNPAKNVLSESEIKALKDEDLITKIKNLSNIEHTIFYYGPQDEAQIIETVNTLHNAPAQLVKIEKNKSFVQPITTESNVIIAPYDAKQIYLSAFSNRGEKFNADIVPIETLYNEYFGGGMNSIVFQEMREARGLAYSAGAGIISPTDLERNYIMRTMIATQNDKMMDALTAFDEIINEMPKSENAFTIAKEALLSRLRTQRVLKSSVLWAYKNAQDLGLDYDMDKVVFEKVQNYTLDDVVKFQEEWVKGRKYTICILGDEKDLDMRSLSKYGPIKRVTTSDIFGY